jgi:hypothetical protein
LIGFAGFVHDQRAVQDILQYDQLLGFNAEIKDVMLQQEAYKFYR